MASRVPTVSANDEEDLVTVEDIEQLCSRMSKYEPCFRISLIQHHLKRLGIACNDERLAKLMTLSFETMIRSIITDCANVNKDNHSSSKTLTSELLNQTLLNIPIDNNNQIMTNSQQSANSTLDINDFFDS
ncbi:unnamed protein product [Rotaria magnacalcarata]|uniref:Uncharacterized protein n=1 Tax=Rotaria magnacalcarata TaxID=392030 RepID=A0A816N7T2_9BILA|nr:unnamed protein product [Rotaria magnacalcarata]CAF2012198.1 unnamed protein product [Rotaria magnacalcarata]CAF4198776.1 unnamed protein product [Rotaria magnacalcarata]CAF4315643.1 unnamed protein product [Rotaria magnacalcarata]